MKKKEWKLKTKNDKTLTFFPKFGVNEEKETICQTVIMREGDNEYIINYLDLMMFCYFIGSEEHRMKLANTELKKVREIPYDVTFKISQDEKKAGIAKRRIVLTIDELIAAYCRNEAMKQNFKNKLKQRS